VFTEFAESWLADAVRGQDRDRFIAAMFCPETRRAGVFAVAAFHAEIATVRERVGDPQVGHIRLLWWRDALERAHAEEDAEAAPLLRLLAGLRDWPELRPHLIALVDAHAGILDEPPLADAEAARRRIAGIATPLSEANAVAMGLPDWTEHAEMARNAALGHGLTVLLRGTASALRRGRSPWAADLGDPRARADLARSVADVAEAAIAAAIAWHPPRRAFPLIVPALLARQHLRRLRRAGDEPLDGRFAAPSRVTLGLLLDWLRCRR